MSCDGWIQVLEELYDGLAIEVLRCSATAFAEKLVQLPRDFLSLAAPAEFPELAAMLKVATGHSSYFSEYPTISLCVDTEPTQHGTHATVAVTGSAEALDAIAGAAIWHHAADLSKDGVQVGLFSLLHRVGTVVCHLLTRSKTLRNKTLCIPDSACIMMGPACGNMPLEGVTFQCVPALASNACMAILSLCHHCGRVRMTACYYAASSPLLIPYCACIC